MRRIIKIALSALMLLIVLGGAGYVYLLHSSPPQPPELTGSIRRDSVQIGTLTRTYEVYIPANLPERPALVLALHGSKGTGHMMRIFTGYEFDRLADANGFLMVYPDGFEEHWNDCRREVSYKAKLLNVDDIGFIRTLIQRFQAAYDVDPRRVFAVGFSNGGHMAYRLALEMPEKFGAVAAIGANFPAEDNFDCTPSGQPISVLVMNGTDDPINPYDGGEVGIYGFLKRGRVLSAEETARYFAHLAGYEEAPLATIRRSDGRLTWAALAGPEVTLYTVVDGGHTIPQGRFRFPRLLGTTNSELNGPLEIWRFFDRQAGDRPSRPVAGS